ncbi:MAG: AraC family transcriptional regulator [Hespellia sp.]|nr:AraC family transcriptional regulator [Hespellia sp.]
MNEFLQILLPNEVIKLKKDISLHEKNKYKNISFPFEIYKVDKYAMRPHGRGFDNLHWHEEIQYTRAVKGTLTMQINGQNYHLNEGEAIFINSQHLHMAKEMEETGQYISMNFSTRLLSFSWGSLMEKLYVLPYVNDYLLPVIIFNRGCQWKKKVLQLLDDIETVYEQKTDFAWEYKISMLLCEIWYLILTNVKTEPKDDLEHVKLKQERIQQLLSFIHQNYSESLTLEKIADAAHISISECTRRFREYTGHSPYEYLIQYRISEATILLLKTEKSVSQIAENTGFQDTSSFIQAFKKRAGTTPLKYRKLHLQI